MVFLDLLGGVVQNAEELTPDCCQQRGKKGEKGGTCVNIVTRVEVSYDALVDGMLSSTHPKGSGGNPCACPRHQREALAPEVSVSSSL